MADPTLRDVLDALVRLEKGQAALEKGQATLEKSQATLEKGQGALEKSQATLEKGQATLEKGQGALEKGQAVLSSDLTSHRLETAQGFADIALNVADHRRETKDAFDALDRELQGHADPLHRNLEKVREAEERRRSAKGSPACSSAVSA